MTSQSTKMPAWPIQDAKARFSELVETCRRDGPQLVTKRGQGAVVLVPAEEWERLNRARPRTLKELLLADTPRGDLNIPPRGRLRQRPPPTFD